jgi:hypothetical protein
VGWIERDSEVVVEEGSRPALATIPNPQCRCVSTIEPNRNHWNGCYHLKTPNCTEPAVFWPFPKFRPLKSFVPIKYLNSDHITIWYICKRCSFACSFACSSADCDLIKIRWVTVKLSRKMGTFPSHATNIDWIAMWRIGGERTCKTASIAYISYCETIRTQILNWSQISEFAKIRLRSMLNLAKEPRVYVRTG